MALGRYPPSMEEGQWWVIQIDKYSEKFNFKERKNGEGRGNLIVMRFAWAFQPDLCGDALPGGKRPKFHRKRNEQIDREVI